MLDAQTKARIDSSRDILVGKVPDPKSQVEQITIALIYKFMDDMDRQSEEFGGKPSFFTGAFKKYRWSQLLDKRVGGHERLILYAEGIEKMNENKNIPQLFRDIFKGVFLPYRDPETLNLFLKEIDGFTYEHSERLGDAYEYLLNVLGTQGDAGQFRTPRHIIDFIVAVVDPRKEDTVLDPACGTAGFLISAYKHILKHNENLTPDERARLMTNFCGYDIAPDMVRLSRVNMYLHGFPNPIIHEYDALTSEERWDERYDVIMANPPFMTPKGGIRPHNRFAIHAKRSEVLFVDYIAEHLNPGGHAGVIVPEGIIFQSQNAYKKLRRMLVENYLWAVVSLPAGVFNPYSGVKTSILFFDRNLAKRTEEVLFVKIENDGFDLGAQRRPIEGSQVQTALNEIEAWRKHQKPPKGEMALAVSRKRLLESSDYNLSGDRYRAGAVRVSVRWPMLKLEEVCEFMTGGTPSSKNKAYWENGDIPWLVSGDIHSAEITECEGRITSDGMANSNAKFLPKDSVLIALNGQGKTRGTVALLRMPKATCNQSIVAIVPLSRQQLLPEFLFYQLRGMYAQIRARTGDNERSGLSISIIKTIEIALPPLAEQERLVAELDAYRKLLEAAGQIVANYKPTFRIDPKWPQKTIRELATEIQYGLSNALNTNGSGYKTFRMNEIHSGQLVDNGQMKCVDVTAEVFNKHRLRKWDLLFNRTNSYEHVGRTGIFQLDGDYTFASYLVRLSIDERSAIPLFVNAFMNTPQFQDGIKGFASRAIGQANISASNLASYAIPVPPLDTQRQIVGELEAERKLVDANRELIVRMEKKIQATLAEIWGEPPQVSPPSPAAPGPRVQAPIV
jgi:type I restriction enzyme M protein